jgi:hypothetical protein
MCPFACGRKRHLSAGLAYKFSHQLLLAAVGGSWPFFYFFGLLLLFLQKFAWVVGIVYTLRLFLLLFFQNKIFGILKEKGLLMRAPLLDAFMAIFYGLFVPLGLMFPNKRKW